MKRYFLIILFGTLLTTLLTIGCKKDKNAPQIPTDGLVAYYPFNGNANDESGNNNNGTVYGATLTKDRHGNPDKAYNFREFNYGDKIIVPNSSSLSFSDEISISLWIKQLSQIGMDDEGNVSPNSKMTFISKDLDRGDFYWSTSNNATMGTQNMTFAINNKTDNSSVPDYSSSLINNVNFNNNWKHYVMTYNKVSGVTKFYINDNLIPSQTTIGTANIAITEANNKDLIIGCQKGFGWAPNGWYPFNGVIDDIRIYNRELSQSEINALYSE